MTGWVCRGESIVRWWVLIILPVALYVFRLVAGALLAMVEGIGMGVDPPRPPRFGPKPQPRGFPVLPLPPAAGQPAVDNGAELIRAAPVPVQPLDADVPDDCRGEIERSGMLLDLIEPFLEVADAAVGIAAAVRECKKDVRESESLLRTPGVANLVRPETAVDGVMELRRKRAEAAAEAGPSPAVE
jgi:hypothetical protein